MEGVRHVDKEGKAKQGEKTPTPNPLQRKSNESKHPKRQELMNHHGD